MGSDTEEYLSELSPRVVVVGECGGEVALPVHLRYVVQNLKDKGKSNQTLFTGQKVKVFQYFFFKKI